MAVTSTVILAGVDTFIVDFNFGLNTDTISAAVPHGIRTFPAVPLQVSVAQTVAGTVAMDPRVIWDASDVVCAKTIVAAGATGTFRVTLKRPHSIGR